LFQVNGKPLRELKTEWHHAVEVSGIEVQIPTEAERAFRLKPNTDSEGSRTPVPTESEQ